MSYLGGWLVDGATLRGGQLLALLVKRPKSSRLLSSSGPGLSQTTLPTPTHLSGRERKELEAQQEAAEVQKHAAQARFSRQNHQAELYGVEPQPSGSMTGGVRTQPLSGLQEWKGSSDWPRKKDCLPTSRWTLARKSVSDPPRPSCRPLWCLTRLSTALDPDLNGILTHHRTCMKPSGNETVETPSKLKPLTSRQGFGRPWHRGVLTRQGFKAVLTGD